MYSKIPLLECGGYAVRVAWGGARERQSIERLRVDTLKVEYAVYCMERARLSVVSLMFRCTEHASTEAVARAAASFLTALRFLLSIKLIPKNESRQKLN